MKKNYMIPVLAFFSLTGFAQTVDSVYTTPGTFTFTVPPGVTEITVEAVGGGGSGGGNGGGGGGGGGYAKGIYTVVPGANLTVEVGSAAGTSSVGALLSATGGANGVSVSNPNIGGGGAGGIGSGGNIANYTGGTGGGGYWTYFGGGGAGAAGAASNGSDGGNTIAWTGMCQTPGGSAGSGGGAPGGNGGKGAGFTDVNCTVSDPSAGGANFGGGGGGGNGNGGGPGAGAGGYCKITWQAASDIDGDGYDIPEDCNDNDNTIFPGAPELCDGLDNNCSQGVDEGLTFITYYQDLDGDTYGNPSVSQSACSVLAGYVTDSSDCNDALASVHPGATDLSGNGIDENCDGVDGVLGIESQNLILGLTVHPNPAAHTLFITASKGAKLSVRILNLNGSVVMQQNMNSEDAYALDVSAIIRGFYIVEVTDVVTGNTNYKRLVISR